MEISLSEFTKKHMLDNRILENISNLDEEKIVKNNGTGPKCLN